MGKILEKLMKKYWKNAKNTGKVYEKILEKCKKNWKSQGNSSVQKSGNHVHINSKIALWPELRKAGNQGQKSVQFLVPM